MKVKELAPDSNIRLYKLRIPKEGIEQLTDTPLEEGYIVSFHTHPGGWFMSEDPPDAPKRGLIPTYGDNVGILEWEIVEKI